jgi:hypothetical protein
MKLSQTQLNNIFCSISKLFRFPFKVAYINRPAAIFQVCRRFNPLKLNGN